MPVGVEYGLVLFVPRSLSPFLPVLRLVLFFGFFSSSSVCALLFVCIVNTG